MSSVDKTGLVSGNPDKSNIFDMHGPCVYASCMSLLQELSSVVRRRRADMGLTQASLAKLSGLSRATVNQVEKGTIHDLSLNRAVRLLDSLGLQVTVASPRSHAERAETAGSRRSSALLKAAQTASVSFKVSIGPEILEQVLTTKDLPKEFVPHLHTLLEEAPISLLAGVVEELHLKHGADRAQIWSRMRELARQFLTGREQWH
jgi:transcriptional regulator with XRE-family HTH domain